MQIVKFRDNLCPSAPVVLTIGNFDGVHLGHRSLIGAAVKDAKQCQCSAALVTFDPHPQEIIHPQQKVAKISTLRHRVRLLEDTGVDIVHIIPFTPRFSQLSPEDFALHFMIERFNLAKVVIGYDFRFGKNRGGDFKLLEKMSREYKFDLEEVYPVQVEGQTVSSTLIRELIGEYRFEEIPAYLGRKYGIYSVVQQGDQRGRQLGFHTANIYPEVVLPLPHGVYVSEIAVRGSKKYGVTNVGVRPTFNKSQLAVETWIFDFDEDIYGEMIEVLPLKLIRPEKKFDNISELKQQIEKDVETAKTYLAEKFDHCFQS